MAPRSDFGKTLETDKCPVEERGKQKMGCQAMSEVLLPSTLPVETSSGIYEACSSNSDELLTSLEQT